jgi:hypothetical protein
LSGPSSPPSSAGGGEDGPTVGGGTIDASGGRVDGGEVVVVDPVDPVDPLDPLDPPGTVLVVAGSSMTIGVGTSGAASAPHHRPAANATAATTSANTTTCARDITGTVPRVCDDEMRRR